ncbi:F-box/WD repeat-containing protein 4, variant 2 [Chamberlinius hualienensis]
MPWIQLSSERLWISQGQRISGFKHTKYGLKRNREKVEITSSEDACRFVLKNNTIVIGGSAGGIIAYSLDTGKLQFSSTRCHREEINGVDYYSGMVVSGSRDKTVKVWLSNESKLIEKHRISFSERIWSVAIDPLGTTFATGTSGTDADPLCIFDVQTGSILSRLKDNFVPGSGIFHIVHETPKSILTCGFDTMIRLWDLRTMQCVTKWTNPYDMAVLCLSSDHTNSFISGSGSSSLVCLWDNRKQNPVQAFYADGGSSPVYSVAFDPYHLFVSLDRSLKLLDFT